MEVSVCKSGLSVHDSHSLQAQSCLQMLLILMEVFVKVACQSTAATDCCHRVISMVLILVEVSVNVAFQSTTATFMVLTLVEVL